MTELDDARKDFCQLLGKLYIPSNPGELSLLLLHMLLSDLDEVRRFSHSRGSF